MPRSPADSVIDLYQTHSNVWDTLRRQDLMEQNWIDRFLTTLPPSGRDVIDLGCGSARPVGEYLIKQGCKITGVDGACAMTDLALTRFPDQRWITADMRALPPLGKFHGIIAWHSFFHLTPEDQRPMFKLFSQLAHAGAPLMFTSGTELGEAIGSFKGAPLYHGSLGKSEYQDLLQAHDFELIQHVEEDINCGGATVWLARKCETIE